MGDISATGTLLTTGLHAAAGTIYYWATAVVFATATAQAWADFSAISAPTA